MSDNKRREFEAMWWGLVQHARRLGAGNDSEDVALEAARRTLIKTDVEKVGAYAHAALESSFQDEVRKRRRRATLVPDDGAGVEAGDVDAEERRDDLERLASLAGALEQVGMWRDSNPTHLLLRHTEDFDPAVVCQELSFFVRLIERLPRGRRSRADHTAKFAASVRCALGTSGYRLRSHDVEDRAAAVSRPTSDSAAPENATVGDGTAIATIVHVAAFGIEDARRPTATPMLTVAQDAPSLRCVRHIERDLQSGVESSALSLFQDEQGNLFTARLGRVQSIELRGFLPALREPLPGGIVRVSIRGDRDLLVLGGQIWRGVGVARWLQPRIKMSVAIRAAITAYNETYHSKEER